MWMAFCPTMQPSEHSRWCELYRYIRSQETFHDHGKNRNSMYCIVHMSGTNPELESPLALRGAKTWGSPGCRCSCSLPCGFLSACIWTGTPSPGRRAEQMGDHDQEWNPRCWGRSDRPTGSGVVTKGQVASAQAGNEGQYRVARTKTGVQVAAAV